MEITYQRNLYKSYMCIETTEDFIEEHELMMLQKYKIPQLLPMHVMIQDGKVQYWFEITGKQQLKDYLGGRQIGTELLKKILFSIENVCRKLPEYLLKEDRLCLSEELLYVDLVEETVYFTYLPFWNGSFPNEFRRWMEEALKNIDHQDRKCTELAYDIYEKCRDENTGIHELLKRSREQMGLASEPMSEPISEKLLEKDFSKIPKKETPEQEKSRHEYSFSALKEKGKNIWEEKKIQIEEVLSKSMENFLRISLNLKIPLKRKETKKKEIEKKEIKKKENKEILFKKSRNIKNHMVENNIPLQNLEEDTVYQTELLCREQKEKKGWLSYQGTSGCLDFCISKEKFLIGRNSKQVDGQIQTDGISRVHARITKREGGYYIEDLNSTNGTYLNGDLLEYHRVRKLNQNDRVRFGNEEYLFYEKD